MTPSLFKGGPYALIRAQHNSTYSHTESLIICHLLSFIYSALCSSEVLFWTPFSAIISPFDNGALNFGLGQKFPDESRGLHDVCRGPGTERWVLVGSDDSLRLNLYLFSKNYVYPTKCIFFDGTNKSKLLNFGKPYP